jgi:CheY-like chemotaxis protein
MQSAGAASVSVRAVDLTADDCLELYGDARPGPHVEIAVTDSGTGLSAEGAKRLFAEPFFSTKPRRRGFGLAIAYGVLHAHHGGLRLRPGAAGGMVAEAYLPVAGPAPAAAAAAEQPARGEKVLVVDDDPNILRFICATLERAGYRAQGATSAEEALAQYVAAAPERFRLVLSDVIMPKVTGVDLARRLLSHDPDVRALFMSGQTTSDFTRLDFAANRFEFLSKPFRPEGLLRAVRGAIERAPAPATRPPQGAGARPTVSL